MGDTQTWYEVSTTIGSLPPLLPGITNKLVKKFDSKMKAAEWADRFRYFLTTQKRSGSTIEPSDEEIEFLGGDHCALEFHGIEKMTKTPV